MTSEIYAVVNGKKVSLTDPSAMLALAESAMLTSLGHSDEAAEYEAQIKAQRDGDS